MQEIKKVTWYTVVDGKIADICITREGVKPLPENKEWIKSPTNNTLHMETPVERYDENMKFLNDEEWLKKQGKKDPRGKWYHKGREKQDVQIYGSDAESPGDDYTQEPPLENEAYQKFDEKKKKWVVDAEKKEKAEKDSAISRKQAAIEDAERRIQRSTRAKLAGTATEEDEQFFTEINAEINQLRSEKQQLLSA